MSVFCQCCMLSGRGLCFGLITRPEESYWLWCVLSVCDREASTMKRFWLTSGCCGPWKKKYVYSNSFILQWYDLRHTAVLVVCNHNFWGKKLAPSSRNRKKRPYIPFLTSTFPHKQNLLTARSKGRHNECACLTQTPVSFSLLLVFDKWKWNLNLHMLVYVEWKAKYLCVTVGIVFNLVFGLPERWLNGCSYTNRIKWVSRHRLVFWQKLGKLQFRNQEKLLYE